MNPPARRGRRAALAALTIVASACRAADPAAPPAPAKERPMFELSSSRPPAPRIAPVIIGAVRYEPTTQERRAPSDKGPGILGAYDAATGQRLWTLKVYVDEIDPNWESDVQEDHFATMTATPEGKLLIVTETQRRFEVDPATRTARALP
jgi:hypothetical protein